MMPHDIILVNLAVGIIGKSFCIYLNHGDLVLLLIVPHFALSKKKLLLQVGQPDGRSVTDDGFSLFTRK
jgi:hypothetical protein